MIYRGKFLTLHIINSLLMKNGISLIISKKIWFLYVNNLIITLLSLLITLYTRKIVYIYQHYQQAIIINIYSFKKGIEK